ncbi:MAG: alpha-isopropylmalate synthase regulatory domain-containing protein, partial [Candidatus Peribacteraceae bacterium]
HHHLTWGGKAERGGMAGIAQFTDAAYTAGYSILPEDRHSLLVPTAHKVARVLGYSIAPETPTTGHRAKAHKAGMHTRAMKQYEHDDPCRFGNHRVVLLSDQAGASTVVEFVNLHPQLSLSVKELLLQNDHPQRFRDLLKEDAQRGISYQEAPESFVLRALRDIDAFQPHFAVQKTKWNYDSEVGNGDVTNATVVVNVNGDAPLQEIEMSATGDGPVDAVHNALILALQERYPSVKGLKLDDYHVRKITGGDFGAVVEVVCFFKDEDGVEFSTMGSSTNIITASELALMDGFYFQRLRQKMALDSSSTEQLAEI